MAEEEEEEEVAAAAAAAGAGALGRGGRGLSGEGSVRFILPVLVLCRMECLRIQYVWVGKK